MHVHVPLPNDLYKCSEATPIHPDISCVSLCYSVFQNKEHVERLQEESPIWFDDLWCCSSLKAAPLVSGVPNVGRKELKDRSENRCQNLELHGHQYKHIDHINNTITYYIYLLYIIYFLRFYVLICACLSSCWKSELSPPWPFVQAIVFQELLTTSLPMGRYPRDEPFLSFEQGEEAHRWRANGLPRIPGGACPRSVVNSSFTSWKL